METKVVDFFKNRLTPEKNLFERYIFFSIARKTVSPELEWQAIEILLSLEDRPYHENFPTHLAWMLDRMLYGKNQTWSAFKTAAFGFLRSDSEPELISRTARRLVELSEIGERPFDRNPLTLLKLCPTLREQDRWVVFSYFICNGLIDPANHEQADLFDAAWNALDPTTRLQRTLAIMRRKKSSTAELFFEAFFRLQTLFCRRGDLPTAVALDEDLATAHSYSRIEWSVAFEQWEKNRDTYLRKTDPTNKKTALILLRVGMNRAHFRGQVERQVTKDSALRKLPAIVRLAHSDDPDIRQEARAAFKDFLDLKYGPETADVRTSQINIPGLPGQKFVAWTMSPRMRTIVRQLSADFFEKDVVTTLYEIPALLTPSAITPLFGGNSILFFQRWKTYFLCPKRSATAMVARPYRLYQ